MKKKAKKIISTIATFILLIAGAFYFLFENGYLNNTSFSLPSTQTNTIADGQLKIYFVDVGQADSILVTTKEANMLIDAGNNEDGEKLVNYFKSLGIDSFKYVIGTHAHEDHIGGLDDIIDNFNIETFYMPDALTTTKTFEDVLDSLDKKNIKYTVPNINDSFTLDEANITILYTGTDTDNLNNSSIVLRMDYGSVCTLFMGDATTKIEKEIINKNITCDVIKIGHHGSSTSSGKNFINKVKPKYAIISVGLNNTYNLPKESVLEEIRKAGAKIYRTDEVGTIIMTTDGTNISFETIKTDTNGV